MTTNQESIRITPIYLKTIMLVIAIVTCTGYVMAWIDNRYTSAKELKYHEKLDDTKFKNIKDNYEFNIKAIRIDIRKIQKSLEEIHKGL